MAAAAWKGVILGEYVPSGRPFALPVSGDDVANNNVTFDTNGALGFFIPGEHMVIKEIDIVTGGTDCNKLQLFVSGRDVGITLSEKTLLTSLNPPHLKVPIRVRAGRQIMFKQLAV